ncbi:MAG: hypothetical protein QF704_15980, partial [Anaerolineales bacterium]|nr:hypothetical protein [Anaerolineales bacterium]
GEGIRFTSDGTTFLDFEIERYTGDSDKGSLIAWVEIPTLSASAATYFYIHYGYDGSVYKMDRNSQVWDGQSTGGKTYVAVNHLKDQVNTDNTNREIVGSLGDGTDSWNAVNMNPDHAASGQATGKIGYGLEFAGEDHGHNDRLCLDDINSSGNFNCSGGGSQSSHFDAEQPNRTVEFWYWAEDNLSTETNVSKVMFDGASQNDGQGIYIYNSNIYAGSWRDGTQHEEWTNYATTLEAWHHVAFVTDGASTSNDSGGSIILYLDGVKVDDATGDLQVDYNGNPTALGGIYGRFRNHVETDLAHKTDDSGSGNTGNAYSHYFDGKLDEFRVTNSVLSADYIKNSYNTQNDPTNF